MSKPLLRQDLLDYIKKQHGKALQRVKVEITDTQETLAFVLHDAMTGETAEAQKAIADREVSTLLADKKATLADAEVATDETPQEVTNVR